MFAIVITLLILDIRFPEVPYSQFAANLTSVLPRILAYVRSFIIIGLYWVIHLATKEFSDKYLRSLMPNYIFVNGAYLGAILLANSYPLVSYLIYIAVVLLLIVFLPKTDDGINYQTY